MLKLKIPSKFLNLIAVVGSYMFNRYIALLPLSAFMPLCMATRIFNTIKHYLSFDINGDLSWKLILTLVATLVTVLLLTMCIYFVLNLMTKYIYELYQEIKLFYINIYRNVYYPSQKGNDSNKNTISYFLAIEIIKTSAFGVFTKNQSIVTGTLKEKGGCVVKKQSALVQIFDKKGYEEYIPTSEELFEEKKEELIYQKILQDFLEQSEKYNGETITRVTINKNQLEDFLYKKQLEIQ